MKINPLILAFPILCFACNTESSPQDPASHMDASPSVAKKVVAANMLSTDYNYDEPCNILGEEYIRGLYNVAETTELQAILAKNGCSFAWDGNKVTLTFGGVRPYQSIYNAEYAFDKAYQGEKSEPLQTPVGATEADVISGPQEQGTASEAPIPSETPQPVLDDKHPDHAGVSAAAPSLTAPPVSIGHFEAVPGIGDKAVWNPETGTMHVLYINHIINVTVNTKEKSEAKIERAKTLADVLIEKIADNEYIRRL